VLSRLETVERYKSDGGGEVMVKEIYTDYDSVIIANIEHDIKRMRLYCPSLKFQIFKSSPDKNNYHLRVFNINVPFAIAMEMLAASTYADPSYIALVKFKGTFFIRTSTRIESDGKVTPPPVLILEG